MDKGQPFQLVIYDSNYIWAVGRAIDDLGNEQAFHHLKLRQQDGVIDSALYKEAGSEASSWHILLHSDKNLNGEYLWSCGYFTDGSQDKAIYSLVTLGNLYAQKQTASSRCFGIQGISSTKAFVIRAIFPTTITRNYFLSMINNMDASVRTLSYNMENKIDVGISLEKTLFIKAKNVYYMIGEYQFQSSTDFQGYLMKMSFSSSNPTYNTETCDSFTLNLSFDSPSLFETKNTWTDESSPTHIFFSHQTSGTISISALIYSLNPLLLISGSYSTTYTCATPSPAIIVASTTVNQFYDLGTQLGKTQYQVPEFTLSPSGSAGTIVYADLSSISEVSFDSTTLMYSWLSLTSTGTYTLIMEGSLSGSTTVTTSFTLTITQTTISVDSPPSDQIFLIGGIPSTTSYTVPDFSTNPPGGSIVYTDVSGVGKPASVTLIGTTYNWFSVTSTPQTFTLTLQGAYNGALPVALASFQVSITSTFINPQTAISHNNMLYFGSTSLTISPFTTIPASSASSIVYSDISTPSLPSGMSFNSANREYSWTTSTQVGTYQLKMQGLITSILPQTVSITLIITAPLIKASRVINQVYDLNTLVGTTSYTVPPFTTLPSGIENMIIYRDVSVSAPTAVTFAPTLRQYDWSGISQTGNFTLIMKGSISGCVPVTISFNVSISKISPVFAVTSNSPPFFEPVLSDITIDLGQSQIFKFPQILDPDQGDIGSFVSLNIGVASTFVTGTYPTLMITPITDPIHVGTFPISVTIKDNHSKMATFYFQIIVQSVQESSKNQNTTSTQNQNQTTQQTNQKNNSNVSGGETIFSSQFEKVIVKKINNKNLKTKPLELSASLFSINNDGIATIEFNKDIYVVKNLSFIDQKVLGINIIPGVESNSYDLNISSWNVTSMEPRKILIKIQFQTLLKISLHDSKDWLEILFKNPQYIVDQETGVNINAKTILRRKIPKQMPKDSATVILQSLGPSAKSTMGSFMVGNFAIQLLMAASLQMLWSMINVMQIIAHMPLLNVQFPENTMFFYSLIIDISSFNLIPDSWMKLIKKNLFNFQEEEFDEQFTKMGYESEIIIENLGSMFMYFLGIVLLVLSVLLIRSLKKKHQLLNKIYNYLAKRLFWNIIIRIFLEGYMQYAITSLINLQKLQWDTRSNSFSSVFSILIFIWIFMFPFLVWQILWKNQEKLKEQESMESFGSTYMELRTESKSALLYNVIYMLRRLFISVVILVFKKWPFAQIQLLIFHCILVIIYIKLTRPFEKPLLNSLEIFNELCIIGASYHLFVFTQYVDDPLLQYIVGWSMIGVTALNIVVNMGIMGYASFKELKQQLMKLNLKIKQYCKKRKEIAYKEPIQSLERIAQENSGTFQAQNNQKVEKNVADSQKPKIVQKINANDTKLFKHHTKEEDKKSIDIRMKRKRDNRNRRVLQLSENNNETYDFNTSNKKVQESGPNYEETKNIQAALFQLPINRGFPNKSMGKNMIKTPQSMKKQVIDEEEQYNFNIRD